MIMSPIIGHRGCAGLAPENTLAGIRDAARVGCSWIEADATLLADGTVVLFHDDTLDRCTNGSGFICEMTYEQLLTLDAGVWFGAGRFVGERVPTLKDALTCCRALGLGFNIELKVHRGEGVQLGRAVSAIITENRCPDLLISSFDFEALGACETRQPKGLLYDVLPAHWQEDVSRLKPATIHLWQKQMSQEDARAVKASGLGLYVFTVNEPELRDALDVDGVFSDFPDRFL